MDTEELPGLKKFRMPIFSVFMVSFNIVPYSLKLCRLADRAIDTPLIRWVAVCCQLAETSLKIQKNSIV